MVLTDVYTLVGRTNSTELGH